MNRHALIYVITVMMLFWCSCWGIKTQLDKDDLSWLGPYEEGDVIIFSSSTGLLDTCYIIGKNIYYSDYKPNGVPTKYTPQVGEIRYQRRGVLDSFEQGEIITIQKDYPDSQASKSIEYSYSYFSAVDRYEKINPASPINGRVYSDLWMISKWDTSWKPKAELLNIKPKLIYWSKSTGLVKYITYSGEVWELKEKLHRR